MLSSSDVMKPLILLAMAGLVVVACEPVDPDPVVEEEPEVEEEPLVEEEPDPEEEAREIVEDWHEESQRAFEMMMDEYGEPDAISEEVAIWHDTDPYHRTEITADATEHNFPMPHYDVMEQYVYYEVPEDMVGELAEFTGSVIVSRTRGELSARCDEKAPNFLALNLAHEIIEGALTPDEARTRYGEEIQALMAEEPTEYTQELLFDPMDREEAEQSDEALPELIGRR